MNRSPPSEIEKQEFEFEFELRFNSVPPAELRAAVLIGSMGVASAHRLPKDAPSIDRILLVVTPEEATSDLVASIDQVQKAISAEIFLVVPETKPVNGEATVYLSIAQFLLELDQPIEQIFFAVTSQVRSQAKYTDFVAAIDDIRWNHSRLLFQQLSDPTTDTRLMLYEWARFLDRHGYPFHALKFYYWLCSWIPPERLAPHALDCLSRLECHEAMADWTHFLKEPWAGTIRECVPIAIAETQKANKKQLAANLDVLEKFHLALATRLRNHTPERKRQAWLKEDPWLPRFSALPLLSQRGYALFFSLDAGRIIEHNPPRSPRGLIRSRASWISADSLLIGSLSAYSTLVTCAANSMPLMAFEEMLFARKEQAIYVIETDFDYFYRLLEEEDFTSLFSRERFHFFIGEEAVSQWETHMLDHPLSPLPVIRLDFTAETVAASERVANERARRKRALERQLAALWDGGHLDEIARILSGHGDRALRVWMHTSNFNGFPPNHLRDIQAAFESLGVVAHLFHENLSWERLLDEGVLISLVDFRPDLVLLYNDLRTTLSFRLPESIPVICLFEDQDPHLIDPENVRRLGSVDLTFAMADAMVHLCRELEYPHVERFSVATNPEIYRPDPSLPPPIDAVALVSQMVPLEDPRGYPGFIKQVFRLLGERGVKQLNLAALTQMALEAADTLGLPVSNPRELGRAALFVERQYHLLEVVRWLTAARVPLALFGRAWDRWPEFREFARGELPQGPPLARAYQHAKVLVHVNSAFNCHQRVFEGISSGAFLALRSLASDRAPRGLGDYLTIGHEVTTFSTADELLVLVDRAFTDELWRQSIVQAGRKRVLAEHTYAHRMKQILDQVGVALSHK